MSGAAAAAAADPAGAAAAATGSNVEGVVVFDQSALQRTIRGVVFDMDGTLTVPVIDFQYMRQRVGVGPTGDILDIIASWPAEEQQRAHAAIEEIEDQALKDMQAMPGLLELCTFLDTRGLPRGLITRNVLRSVQFFHDNHLPLPPFVPAISRECQFPYKPSPEALLHICTTWGIPPTSVVMVGDSAKDDVVCGNRAGAVTVLLDSEGRYSTPAGAATLEGECRPSVMVPSLSAFHALLEQQLTLAGSNGSSSSRPS